MAKINTGGSVENLVKLNNIANAVLGKHATEISNKKVIGNIIGTESHSDARDTASGNLDKTLRTELTKNQFGMESFTDAQIEAGKIVLMAKGSVGEYAKRALDVTFAGLESHQSDAPMHGVLDFNSEMGVGNEYFNETSLDTHLAASFTFNLIASRQGTFAEAFFPTIVADPSECGMLVEIRKTMIHRAVRHTIHDKDAVPFNRRNILDAATDPTVLEDESIKFVPYRLEDDSNANLFISRDLFEPVSKKVGDYSVPTAPLAMNVGEKRLLGLSAHPGLVSSGILNESDEFDGRVALQYLYFEVNVKGGAADAAQVIRVNTDNLAHASFNKAQEGDGRDMVLNFRNARFGINKETKDITGKPITAFADIIAAGYIGQYTCKVNSDLNLQTGIEDTSATGAKIVSLRETDGTEIDITAGSGKALVEKVVIKCVAYDLKMTRSNSNRRTKGLLVDNVSSQERYKITLGSPITSRKPITGNVDDSQRLNDVIVAARMRNDNLAITKMLSYTETLKEVFESRTDQFEIPTIEGVGRHYVAPWYGYYQFDAIKQVASLESQDVASNLANALLSVLRTQVVTAYRDSRFQPALEMLSGYTISKPEVIIGTDPFTANWLWVQGDIRTLGDSFNYKVVTTNDLRFRDRIQWAFSVSQENGGFCPLHYGNHIWVPELISNTNLSRNDETTNELTVQPRNYHVVNTPITGVIETLNLAHYVQGKPAIDINPRTNPENPLYIKPVEAGTPAAAADVKVAGANVSGNKSK